ncbi:cytoplasmic protein, partial [Enterobacter hormaechei]|nr:cytoplasmic protein [Enterobacter hormaechei subsp. hoffmannii]EMA8088819.1 cytoplasmic protein [Enterobacter hormaechei]HBQ0297387.1 cytoplasmic protein [Klebsiella pneumoniae]HBQ0313473.1 cytoplasmic protein [Klebsiella pneumoniae]HBQ0318997.1 cytoplasmic protein [Klebsiella pneumoniae]
MRVAESIILDALTRGGCIKTFYRISSRQAAESATRIPEGYILESPGEREDIVLSRADFHALEKLLEQKETWEQVVGVTCFGGA